MNCIRLRMPDGNSAIVCGTFERVKPCHVCGVAAPLLCDWKLGGGKTCDKRICGAHAQEVAPDKHLCPEHQAAFAIWRAARAAREPHRS